MYGTPVALAGAAGVALKLLAHKRQCSSLCVLPQSTRWLSACHSFGKQHRALPLSGATDTECALCAQVERKQLPADWRRRLQVIQASAAEAAKALPPGEALCSDAPVEYAAVRGARDRLAAGAERGFFGGLAGPAAVWDKIVRAYERDSAPLHRTCAQAIDQSVANTRSCTSLTVV